MRQKLSAVQKFEIVTWMKARGEELADLTSHDVAAMIGRAGIIGDVTPTHTHIRDLRLQFNLPRRGRGNPNGFNGDVPYKDRVVTLAKIVLNLTRRLGEEVPPELEALAAKKGTPSANGHG